MGKATDLKDIKVYVKPEENAAYYVIQQWRDWKFWNITETEKQCNEKSPGRAFSREILMRSRKSAIDYCMLPPV